jgi:uncharacterized repeat protein (TIGR03803 family)
MKKLSLLIFAVLYFGIGEGKAQYTVLLNFNDTNGKTPYSTLTLSGGKLFGVTWRGGADSDGVIFSIDTNGSGFKVIHNFNDTLGRFPWNGVTVVGNKMYGMAEAGGAYNGGVIFSADTDGSHYRDIYDFDPLGTFGNFPLGILTVSGGMMYGMTQYGGTKNYGVVFSVDTNGSGYKDLLNFNDTNGAIPYGSFVLSGNLLYGMSYNGGKNGYGCVFSIDTNGTRYKDMFDFNVTNSAHPLGNLTLSGNELYGMVSNGGLYSNGCIFSIDTAGSRYSDIYDFNGITGANPYGSLTLSGNTLFGMTTSGGANSEGCVFSIDTNGKRYEHLLDFDETNYPLGGAPYDNLVISGGDLFGLTSRGGIHDMGVIFKMDTTANITTSVKQSSAVSSQWAVYPNPNNGIFTIQWSVVSGQWTVEIYNVLGKKVYSQFTSPNSPPTIDVSSNPNGVYFYRVLDENGGLIGEGKFIIQK